MQKLIINGKKTLRGVINVSGSKNATLPILAASILNSESLLKNVPLVKDTFTMVELLKSIGLKCAFTKKNQLKIFNNERNIKTVAPYKLVKTMRAGVLVLGPLVSKYQRAKVSLPGGCAIGSRPIDLHVMVMEALGANVKFDSGFIISLSLIHI